MRTPVTAMVVGWVLIGIGFLFYYVVIYLLLLPTRVLLALGRVGGILNLLRRPLVFSDARVREVRHDFATELSEGAERILDHNEIESIPVSRHFYRRKGLQAVRDTDAQLSSGEFLISLLLLCLGLAASVATTGSIVSVNIPASGGDPILTVPLLSWISFSSAVIGGYLLVIVTLRSAIVDQFTYDDAALSVGTAPAELLMKATWNQMVAKRPVKVLQLYYLLLFANMIGNGFYAIAKSVMVLGMDPTVDRREALQRGLRGFQSAMERRLADEKNHTK